MTWPTLQVFGELMETFRLPPLAPAVRCHPPQHTTACHPRSGSGAWDNPPTWAATGGYKLGVKFHDYFVVSNELFHSKPVLNKTCLGRDLGWMTLPIEIRFVDSLLTINLSGSWSGEAASSWVQCPAFSPFASVTNIHCSIPFCQLVARIYNVQCTFMYLLCKKELLRDLCPLSSSSSIPSSCNKSFKTP